MKLFLIKLLLTMNTAFSFCKIAKSFRFTSSSQFMSSRQIPKQNTATIQVEDIYSDGSSAPLSFTLHFLNSNQLRRVEITRCN